MAEKLASKTELVRKDKSQKRTIASLRETAKAAPMAAAGATIAGAVAVGAARGYIGTEVGGFAIEPVGGVGVAVVGILLKKPSMVNFAAGWLAPFIADQVEQAVS